MTNQRHEMNPRPARPTRGFHGLVILLVTCLALLACGGADGDTQALEADDDVTIDSSPNAAANSSTTEDHSPAEAGESHQSHHHNDDASRADENDSPTYDLSGLDGQWISEAAFVGDDKLEPLFEQMAELNPGHSAATARSFWSEFRSSEWTSLEIAAPNLTFATDDTTLCDGPFEFRGTEKVGVGSWSADQDAHPPREIPVNLFQYVGDPQSCNENYTYVWFLGAGQHAHTRNGATPEDATAPVPWWPTLRSPELTIDDYASSLSMFVENQSAGALPAVEG